MLRSALVLFFFALFFFALSVPENPLQADERHGLSLFGHLKYPPHFKKFSYVHDQAPKNGQLTIGAQNGFDSLNPFIIKGRPAQYLSLIYDTLMEPSLDEPASSYGLVASAVDIADDRRHLTFTLRKQARFHDGQPIRADDVIWSLQTLKAAHPFYKAYYHDVIRAEKISSHKVRFHFADGTNRELAFILGQLPVLPKHYWSQKNRNFMNANLTPPLGSGPYRIVKVEAGRSITYQRVENYWGKNLPVNIGRHNINTMRIEYFGDDSVAFEAFKARALGWRNENRAANWALGYADIAAKHGAKLRREEIADKNPDGMQAFVFNTRRKKFQSPLLRAAFNYAFDFEWMNRHFFHGAYQRTNSYFQGSDLAATGLPSKDELLLLEKWRGKIPDSVFTAAFANPKTDGSGRARRARRQAVEFLRAAGWEIKNGRLVHAQTGEPFQAEFLIVQPAFEKIILSYKKQLQKLGMDVRVVIVDPAQYRNRLREYDFDVIIHTFSQSLSPGNEQRDFWSSQAADLPGGRNLIGIKNPAVDALVENIIAAQNRRQLIAATRALDRVLLANHYVVPQWHAPFTRIAFWRPLAHPENLPDYGLGFPGIWWIKK